MTNRIGRVRLLAVLSTFLLARGAEPAFSQVSLVRDGKVARW